VPNRLIDQMAPGLKDTELRVLLVVLRQTVGWRQSERSFKGRDWLTHRQLMRRTGRASAAISAAVASLVERGLIVVEDTNGVPLATAEARRRYLGRLYFRPGDMWKTPDERRIGKAKTTTSKDTDIDNRCRAAGTSISSVPGGSVLEKGDGDRIHAYSWQPGVGDSRFNRGLPMN
jgi:hypothetical protein